MEKIFLEKLVVIYYFEKLLVLGTSGYSQLHSSL